MTLRPLAAARFASTTLASAETRHEAHTHGLEEDRCTASGPKPDRCGKHRSNGGACSHGGAERIGAHHAGTTAARETGFSTIGKLIRADSTPNAIDSHHTGS